MKERFRAQFTFRRILMAGACMAAFSAWYAFGFWDVMPTKKPAAAVNSYAAKRAIIQNLVIDPSALYPVVRVIDGDTFVAKIAGHEITVRVLGMDAPETVKPKTPVQCYGPEASEEDKSLLSGRSVRLQIDPTQDKADFYGRLLAYVHRDDGVFLEDHMIQDGFAREYTFDKKKPYEMQKQFKADQAEAQAAKAGLWGACPTAKDE